MFDLGKFWDGTQSTGETKLASDDIMRIMYGLKVQSEPMIIMAPKMHGMICWLHHLAKTHRLPRRKLRKCYLCKRTRRLQQERKRYFDR